jgi:opacity protein-like surface antigen
LNNEEKVMKKILSVAAISALLLTASQGFAGNMRIIPPSLGQDQEGIDQLNSSQARQDEEIDGLQRNQARHEEAISANSAAIQQNAQDIETLKNLQAVQEEEVNPWYIKGTGRATWTGSMDLDQAAYGFKADTDIGYGYGFSLGRQFGNFRIEGEVAAQQADIQGDNLSEVKISTAMLNGFYGIPLYSSPFSVYGTAGIGAAKVEVFFNNDIDGNETTFAYKAGAGVTMEVTGNMAVDVGYEYLRTSDVEVGDELLSVSDIKTSAVNASLRYSF